MADEGLAASLGATAANGLPWDQLKRVYIGPPPAAMPTAPVDPNAGLGDALMRTSVLPPQPPADQVQMNQPFGEVKASPPPSPSDRITYGLQDLLNSAGADTYTANNLAGKLMGLVQATPLSAPLAAADTVHYKNQNDIGGTAMAMAGMIPGVKPGAKAAKKVVQEAAAPVQDLKSWMGQSKVVTPEGAPLTVYRGEHGEPVEGQQFQSKLGSLSFGDKEAANLYAMEPNDTRMKVQAPRVTPGHLKIENPIIHATDDPYIELGHLEQKLGTKEAARIAKKFDNDIQYTNNWEENYAGKYDDVAHLLKENPGELKNLYFMTYKYLDDPKEVALLKKKGFDGAIHLGNAGTMDTIEHRIFDPSQFRSSIGAQLAEPVAAGKVPAVAERYPQTVPPVEAIDPVKKKPFMQKTLSPEAETVQKARVEAQRDINKGNYAPHFDPAQRFDADPANYPDIASTLGQLSKRPKAENAAKYAAASGPEAAARLDEAFQRGMQQKDSAGNWYMMGQLEREFVKEYGPVEGPKQFKSKFADAMAATTGGADPTSNLMMAHYGNYLRAKGEPLPEKSYDYPFPVGGRYAGTNMEQYRKMLMEGAGVTAANPKRYNFSGNFTGNKRGSTIDEQMMGLIEPGGSANPPGGAYGHYEAPVAARAEAAGVDPRFFQEVAWAGAKDAKTKGGYKAKSMIEIVNEAIERTHRITGMAKDEIVRRGLVRSEIPLYGLGATMAGAVAGREGVSDDARQ